MQKEIYKGVLFYVNVPILVVHKRIKDLKLQCHEFINAEMVSSFPLKSVYFSCQDGESGWSSLHRALHFGHLAVACVLLQFGASLTLGDSKSRTPVDLLSGPVLQAVGKQNSLGM